MAAVLLSRALVAAVLTGVMFALKATTIATGRDPLDDPLVNGLFYVGAFGLALTFALAGAALARRRRLLGAALGLLVGVAAGVSIAALASALLPDDGSWVWGEVNLWIIALLTITLVLVLRSRTDASRRAARGTAAASRGSSIRSSSGDGPSFSLRLAGRRS